MNNNKFYIGIIVLVTSFIFAHATRAQIKSLGTIQVFPPDQDELVIKEPEADAATIPEPELLRIIAGSTTCLKGGICVEYCVWDPWLSPGEDSKECKRIILVDVVDMVRDMDGYPDELVIVEKESVANSGLIEMRPQKEEARRINIPFIGDYYVKNHYLKLFARGYNIAQEYKDVLVSSNVLFDSTGPYFLMPNGFRHNRERVDLDCQPHSITLYPTQTHIPITIESNSPWWPGSCGK